VIKLVTAQSLEGLSAGKRYT